MNIEAQIKEILNYPVEIEETVPNVEDWQIEQITNLLKQREQEAVRGLTTDLCNVCRDMVHSKYAIQEQEKKTGGVEKVVRK